MNDESRMSDVQMIRRPGLRLWIGSLLSLAIGCFWVSCFWNADADGWLLTAFGCCFFLWGEFLLHGRARSKESVFFMVCTLLLTLPKWLGRTMADSPVLILALHGFAAYWVLCRAGLLTLAESSLFLPFDLADALLIKPFCGIFLHIYVLLCYPLQQLGRILRERKIAGKTILLTLAALLAALPFFLWAGSLLAQTDDSFAALWRELGRLAAWKWELPSLPIELLLGLPVNAYLFGLLANAMRKETPLIDPKRMAGAQSHLRFLPDISVLTVFGCFITLYLLFFAVQAKHLLSAFLGRVPGDLTAAQYAREGFFQLTMVMAINFGLVGAARLFGKNPTDSRRALRMAAVILMAESLLLAVTAGGRLALYLIRFSFTRRRILTLWGILMMAVGSALTILRLYRPFKAAKLWILLSAGSFTLLCFL